MKSTVPMVLTAIFVGAIVGALALHLYQQHSNDSLRAARLQQSAAIAKVEADKQQARALSVLTHYNDKGLTGDPNGHAEWRAANNDTITCGVTPNERYLITRNHLGTTRYDEPVGHRTVEFLQKWGHVGCNTTAPINRVETQTGWNQKVDEPLAVQFAFEAREFLKANLRDYDSTKFVSPTEIVYRVIKGKKQFSLWGHMNTKNGYGGYIGEKLYAVVESDDKLQLIFDDDTFESDLDFTLATHGAPAVEDKFDDFTPYIMPFQK